MATQTAVAAGRQPPDQPVAEHEAWFLPMTTLAMATGTVPR